MKNRKGFTLTELLVTMVIIGIITGISIPLIRNVQKTQTEKKYKLYGESLKSSAKLYNDSYGEDLFSKSTGCAIVPYKILLTKQLIKDIDISNISCATPETKVKIVKVERTYGYGYQMNCVEEKKGTQGKSQYKFPKDLALECTGANSVYVQDDGTIVYGTMSENGEIVPSEGSTAMKLTVSPAKADKDYNAVSRKTKITILSDTGVSQNIKIKYAWVKDWDKSAKDYSSITNWQTVTYSKLPSRAAQLATIANGGTVSVVSKYIQTPNNASGDYYLILDIEKLCDISDEGCMGNDERYQSYGPYKIDNVAPTIDKFEVKSKGSGYNDKTAIVSYNVSDNQVAAGNLSICISKKECEDTDYKSYSNNYEMKLTDTYDGKEYTIHFGVKDKAGNKTIASKKYKVYKDCAEKVTDGKWKDTSTCTKKCGGGTINQKSGLKDKYTGNVCSGETTRQTPCNEMDCCSKSKETCSYTPWSDCSTLCGGGTKSRKKTCKKVSEYDGRDCSGAATTPETTSCNGQSCCSSLRTPSCGSYVNSGSCSKKCGTGRQLQKQTCTKISAYNGQSCGTYVGGSRYVNCNTQSCCSSVKQSCTAWTQKSCRRIVVDGPARGGSRSRPSRVRYLVTQTRRCRKVSNYDGSACSSYTTSTRTIEASSCRG